MVSRVSVLATEKTKSPTVASPPAFGVDVSLVGVFVVDDDDDGVEDAELLGDAIWGDLSLRITKAETRISTRITSRAPTALRYPMSSLRLSELPPPPPDATGGPG